MQQQRHRGTGQQGKGEYQRKPGDLLQLLETENVIERGEYEGPRHQTGHEGIHHDLNRPVDVFIGVDEKFLKCPCLTVYHGYFTSMLSPR